MRLLVAALCLSSLSACKLGQKAATVRSADAQGAAPKDFFFHGTDMSGGSTPRLISDPTPTIEPRGLLELAGAEDTPYMKACAAAGVPLPPAWGDKAWENKGELKQVALLAQFKSTLYTYTTDEGVCAALPRSDKGVVKFFGIICASNKGKTCFFDNADPKTGSNDDKLIVKPGYHIRQGTGADRLQEVCSDCHRGDNPWVAIPGEPTRKLPQHAHEPMGGPRWQNPPNDDKDVGSCDGMCHSIPKLTVAYCGLGGELIRLGLMPDGGGTDGVDEFQAACDKVRAAGAVPPTTTKAVIPTTTEAKKPVTVNAPPPGADDKKDEAKDEAKVEAGNPTAQQPQKTVETPAAPPAALTTEDEKVGAQFCVRSGFDDGRAMTSCECERPQGGSVTLTFSAVRACFNAQKVTQQFYQSYYEQHGCTLVCHIAFNGCGDELRGAAIDPAHPAAGGALTQLTVPVPAGEHTADYEFTDGSMSVAGGAGSAFTSAEDVACHAGGGGSAGGAADGGGDLLE